MGKYINEINGKRIGNGFREKIDAIMDDGGILFGSIVPEVYDPCIVCVVNNGGFAAAGWAFDEEEFEAFKEKHLMPFEQRQKAWMIYPNAPKFAK